MRSLIILLTTLATAHAAVFERAACNADNCARAVTGTSNTANLPALTVRQSQCSSYQTATFYPSATTTTITSGSTSTTQGPTGPVATVVSGSSVPSYASTPCGASTSPALVASRYASACSCAGFTKTTVTATTQTVTVVQPTPTLPYRTCPTAISGSRGVDGTKANCDGVGSPSGCYCWQVAGQSSYYCANTDDISPGCTTSADCPSDALCVVDTYLGNYCFKKRDFELCVNPAAPARLFRRKVTGRQLAGLDH